MHNEARFRDSLKVLFFDGTGMAIFYKRLDRGVFPVPEAPRADARHIEIDDATLEALLDGIEVEEPVRSRHRAATH
jgi:transposase